jgi:catechol 1,2-dioxygenase
MSKNIARSEQIERFLDQIVGASNAAGSQRTKQIVRRIVSDLFCTIEELDVTPDEYWSAVSYLTSLGQAREVALLSPGLGFDHFIDLLTDAKDREAGLETGTPRTIEGPLYVKGAPCVKGAARLDDGTQRGETLFMRGQVRMLDGTPIPGALVEVWHADTKGNYSFFDPTQSPFNLRRKIETDAEGRYRFRTIMPSGYACSPGSPTQQLLDKLGRHCRRPAHIHFFVSAPGHRHLTTQINIADDPLLNDDFAFATRDGLIPKLIHNHDPVEIKRRELDGPFVEIEFGFVLQPSVAGLPSTEVERDRASDSIRRDRSELVR